MDIKEWWINQTNTDKAVYGLSAFCILSVLYILLTGLLVPDITFLSLDKNNFQIDDKPQILVIKGYTEPNAKIFVNSTELKLDKVPIAVNNNGSFEYTIKIPIDAVDTKVSVISKAPKKYEISQDILIQRPLTYLSIKPVDKLNYEDKKVNIEGKSDPNTNITIVSNMTLRNNLNLGSYMETAFDDPVLNNVSIKADSDGYFKKEFNVPSNSKSSFFNITAKVSGKRESIQGQNITRDFEVFPPMYNIFNIGDNINSSKMDNFSGKGFSISYSNIWQKRSYKNAGKDVKLYLIYGNSVECIVWYGKIGKEFDKSLDDYKQTQDKYLRSWWGATEVFEQKIDYGEVKRTRVVYKCQQNPIFSNEVPAPFYIDRTTLTKNNIDVLELQLIAEEKYYEKNDYLIEKTVQSFNIS